MSETERADHVEDLRRVFEPRAERVREALEQSRQERRRFHEAEQTRQLFEREIQEAEHEAQQMGPQAASALLGEDSEAEMQTLRSRARELKELIADRKKRLKNVSAVLESGDVRTAEQLSLGRAQQVAADEVRAAKKERTDLTEALDEALVELEREAAEATAIQQEYEKEAS